MIEMFPVNHNTHGTNKPCSGCAGVNSRKGQRYCHKCHADYERSWRPLIIKKKVAKMMREMADKIEQQTVC